MTKKEKVCLRCGIGYKENKREKHYCSHWGTSFKQHLWGLWKGKTIKVTI